MAREVRGKVNEHFILQKASMVTKCRNVMYLLFDPEKESQWVGVTKNLSLFISPAHHVASVCFYPRVKQSSLQ